MDSGTKKGNSRNKKKPSSIIRVLRRAGSIQKKEKKIKSDSEFDYKHSKNKNESSQDDDVWIDVGLNDSSGQSNFEPEIIDVKNNNSEISTTEENFEKDNTISESKSIVEDEINTKNVKHVKNKRKKYEKKMDDNVIESDDKIIQQKPNLDITLKIDKESDIKANSHNFTLNSSTEGSIICIRLDIGKTISELKIKGPLLSNSKLDFQNILKYYNNNFINGKIPINNIFQKDITISLFSKNNFTYEILHYFYSKKNTKDDLIDIFFNDDTTTKHILIHSKQEKKTKKNATCGKKRNYNNFTSTENIHIGHYFGDKNIYLNIKIDKDEFSFYPKNTISISFSNTYLDMYLVFFNSKNLNLSQDILGYLNANELCYIVFFEMNDLDNFSSEILSKKNSLFGKMNFFVLYIKFRNEFLIVKQDTIQQINISLEPKNIEKYRIQSLLIFFFHIFLYEKEFDYFKKCKCFNCKRLQTELFELQPGSREYLNFLINNYDIQECSKNNNNVKTKIADKPYKNSKNINVASNTLEVTPCQFIFEALEYIFNGDDSADDSNDENASGSCFF